jgi:hypothetical protein
LKFDWRILKYECSNFKIVIRTSQFLNPKSSF